MKESFIVRRQKRTENARTKRRKFLPEILMAHRTQSQAKYDNEAKRKKKVMTQNMFLSFFILFG